MVSVIVMSKDLDYYAVGCEFKQLTKMFHLHFLPVTQQQISTVTNAALMRVICQEKRACCTPCQPQGTVRPCRGMEARECRANFGTATGVGGAV